MGDASSRRIFLAVDLSDDLRHGLAAHLDAATAGRGLPGGVVRPGNWHLTLRFIGPSDEVGLDRLLAGLDQADLGGPFPMGFGRLGAFPGPARASVLWLGVTAGVPELTGLAGTCEEVCVAAGFDPEERPFAAHLTLSRLRPRRDVSPLIATVPPFPGRQPVDAVTVFESRLGPGGARYEVVERFPLV